MHRQHCSVFQSVRNVDDDGNDNELEKAFDIPLGQSRATSSILVDSRKESDWRFKRIIVIGVLRRNYNPKTIPSLHHHVPNNTGDDINHVPRARVYGDVTGRNAAWRMSLGLGELDNVRRSGINDPRAVSNLPVESSFATAGNIYGYAFSAHDL